MTLTDPTIDNTSTHVGQVLRTAVTAVWLILIAATLVSWYTGTDHGIQSPTTTTILVLLVAFLKVRFVGLYFMELRHAPLPLRALFETYCLATPTTLITLYLTL